MIGSSGEASRGKGNTNHIIKFHVYHQHTLVHSCTGLAVSTMCRNDSTSICL